MITFVPDRVRFHANGAIDELVLAADHEIHGITCAVGSWLSLFDDGALRVFTLAAPAEIAGLALPAGARVQLMPDGQLLSVSRAGILDVQGYPCDGVTQDVGFHPSGGLQRFTLARAASVRGVHLPAGSHLVLDDVGDTFDVFLPEPLVVRDRPAPARQWVRIDHELRVRESPLASVGKD